MQPPIVIIMYIATCLLLFDLMVGLPEKKKSIFILTIAGIVVLFVHFTLTTVFSIHEFVPPTLNQLSSNYTFPVFHQDWKLFAPNLAQYNTELEYRYSQKGNWSEWKDVSVGNNYEATSRIERIEQSFNHQLAWQVTNNLYSENGITQYDRILKSNAYRSALYFVVKMQALNHSEIKCDSLQIRLNFRFTPLPYSVKEPETEQLEFPVYVPENVH